MPQAIVYCDRCGRIIPPGDISRGQALVGEGGGICQSCAGTLTPEQRDVLRLKLTGEMPVVRPPAPPPAPRPATVRMRARDAAPARRMSTRMMSTAQAEPSAGGGGGLQKNIAVIGAVAGVVVGVAIALLIASGGGSRGTSGTGTGTTTPAGTTTPTGGTTPTVTPGVATVPGEDPPRVRLDEIKTWAEDLVGRYSDIMIALKQLPISYPGTPEAAEAEALVQTYEARHAELAEAELAKAVADAKALVYANRALDATRVFSDLRLRFEGSTWFGTRGEAKIRDAAAGVEAAAEAARREALEASAREALARSEKLFEDGDLEAAKRELGARAEWPQAQRARAEEIVKRIDEKLARIAAEAEKARRGERALRAFVVGLFTSGREGLAGPEALVARSRAELEESGKGKDLARFESRLREARTVEELAAVGFEGSRRVVRLQWKDKPVGGRVVKVKDGVLSLKPPTIGDAVDVPIGELAPGNVVDDSGLRLKPHEAAVYFLMRGDLEEARKRLADATGEKPRALREEIDEIAALLAPPPEPEAGPGPAATAAAARKPLGIALLSAGEARGGWLFDNGQEFPGAKGALALDDTVPPERRPALKLDGDFTGGGGYVQTGINLPPTAVEAVSYAIRAPGSKLVTMRLIDSGGQCHQVRLKLDGGDGWQEVRFPVVEFFERIAAKGWLDTVINYEKWGGANDGRWHGPCKGLYVLLGKGELGGAATGSMWLSRVAVAPPGGVPAGLLGRWTFDEGAGTVARDSSGAGRDAKLDGATWGPGKIGGGVVFDGADDFVDLPVSMLGSETGTVAMWVKASGGVGDRGMLFYGSSVRGGDGYGDQPEFHVGFEDRFAPTLFVEGSSIGGADLAVRGAQGLGEGAWHHVAATWVAGGEGIVYVDGVEKAKGAHGAGRFAFSGVIRLGRADKTVRQFAGSMDEVQVYGRALTAAEVRYLYELGAAAGAPGVPEVTAGLVGWWKLDETTGSLAADSSGKGRAGTVRGASWDPAGGRLGGALRFGGNGQHAEVPRPVQDDFTIAFWVRTTAPGGANLHWYEGTGLVDGEVAAPTADFGTALVQGRFGFGTGSTDVTVASAKTVNDGAWHHVAGTRSKATGALKVYVDGVLDGEGVGSTESLTAPPRLALGCLQTGIKYYEGWIDDLRIYDRVLAADEVRSLCRPGAAATAVAAAPGVAGGLLAWWKFDETAGGTIRDHSGKGLDGTLQSGEWRPAGGKLGGALASGAQAVSASFPGPTGPMRRFSVAFWLNPSQVRNHNQWISADGGWGRFAFHAGDGGAAWCGVTVGSRFENTDLFPGIIETGKWQHFAFTFDNGPSRFYKDGALVASKTLAAPENWQSFNLRDVAGAIDDLRIYDRPLDAAEVRTLAGGALSAAPVPAAGGGLVAYLRLDEKDGAAVADASGNKTGGLIRTVGGGGYAWRPEGGKAGGALEFSYSKVAGSNRTEGASIELGNALGLNPTDAVTVACWMNAKTQGGYGFYWPGLVTKPGQYQLRLHEVGKLVFEVWLEGGTSAKVTVPSPPAGEWHHVAGSYDGKTVCVFVDGLLKGNSPAAGRIAVTASGALVGVAPGNEAKYYDGLLDEVRIYGRALGEGDMLALLDPKAAGAAGYVSGLYGEYFADRDLNPAKLKVSRVDMNVNHDWGDGSPAPGMPGDGFSVRWTGELEVPADGTYTFGVDRDDGARLKIGGRYLIDDWSDTAGSNTASASLKAGWAPFEFNFKENGGGARIHLWWSGPGIVKATIPAASFRTPKDPRAAAEAGLPDGPQEPLPGETGSPGEWAPGLVCEIFKGHGLNERVGVRVDPQVDFEFGGCAPDLGLEPGPYVLRWTGYVLAPYDGRYKFEPEGVTVRLDGQSAPVNADFDMTRGLHRFEAIAALGSSKGKAIFRWRLTGAKDRRVVPSSHFFHDVPELGSMGPPAKAVMGLAATYYPGEVPKGRGIEGQTSGTEFDLGESPPCTKLANNRDQFSVRLEGHYMARASGKHIFRLAADDGAQFLLDDNLLIDCWQKAADDPTATLDVKAGWHRIAVLYRERRGLAKLELRLRAPWGRDDKGKPVFERLPADCLFREPGKPELVDRKGVAPGIDCVMYEGDRPGAGKKLLERLDSHLECDWKDDRPCVDLPETNFCASWRGSILVPDSGLYVFSVWRRGGLQLVVGTTSVVREWSQGAGWTVTRPVSLRAGSAALALDYFSQQNDPGVKIYWMGPGFQFRRLGDGDLVRKAKDLELASPWWKKAEEPATAAKPPEPKPGPAPGPGVGPPPDVKAGKPLPAGNLVANGGFEEKDEERKFAARWTKGQWGAKGARSSVRVDMSNPREGGESSLVARAMEAGAKAGASTTLKLEPGTYRVSYWACANAGENATVGAHLGGADLPEDSVGDQWKQFSHEVEVKQKTTTGALRIWTSGVNVRVWFDDVEVVMLKRAEPETD